MDPQKCNEYDQTGSCNEVEREHYSGRRSAPPDTPYSQYYNRGLSGSSSSATSLSSTEPTKQKNSSTNSNSKYATTCQWTAVVNERNDAQTTCCTTILRPQPLYSMATIASVDGAASRAALHPRNMSPSGAAYGYARAVPKSHSALPVPVAPSNPSQLSPPQQASFVRSGPHRRTVSECESTYSAMRKNDTNSTSSQRSNTPTAAPYECVIAKNPSSGAIASAAASVPIFKRGTLQSPPVPPTKPKMVGAATNNISPKKVTFPSSTASTAVYWPTRRGMTVDPPCRQSDQQNQDGVAATGVTGAVDIEAAYTAIYANTGPSSEDLTNSNFSRTSIYGGATLNHQVTVPRSSPAATAQTVLSAPRILPAYCHNDTSDYAAVSVAHSAPYVPCSVVSARSYNSMQRHKGEARYQQLEQQQCYGRQECGASHLLRKAQPALYDRHPHQQQVQQQRARQLEFNKRECEYRSLQPPSESESGSEAGEIRKILRTSGYDPSK